MKSNVVPLNSNKHLNVKVTPDVNYEYLKGQHLIPVVVQEFSLLATEYPIVFIKHEKTGEFQPVIMLGIEQGENLFCSASAWHGLYQPKAIRSYPFALVYKDDQREEFVVCVDESSDCLGEDKQHALFTVSGQQSDYLKKTIENMLAHAEQVQHTREFVSYLADKKLLASNRLTLDIQGEEKVLDGLYVVNRSALDDLPADEFNILRQQGVLSAIYAHLLSLGQITRLIKLKQNKV